MKKSVLLSIAATFTFAVILFTNVIVYTYPNGITGLTKKTSTQGCYCHTQNTGISGSFSGPDTIYTGQTVAFSFTISRSGSGPGGVDISTRLGALAVGSGSAYLKILSGELTQKFPLVLSGGNYTGQFSYTAPSSPGTDTLWLSQAVGYQNGWNWGNEKKIVVKNQPLGLNLTMGIEGFWHGATQVQDTVKIYLANSSPPYNSLDLANIYLNSTGNASANFNSASSGNYYIRVTHRNALETWSTSAVSFTGGSVTNYSFITAQAQAFGNNQLMNLGRWCFFSGDANQDGVIDLSDGSDVDNDAFNFVSGYVNTDVNGDGVVDLTDAAYVDNNAFNFVGVIKP